jgi:hypothetical protein
MGRRRGECNGCGVSDRAQMFPLVIARLVRNCALERAIQYSRAVVIESRGRGVLDSPPSRGTTGVRGLPRRHHQARGLRLRAGAAQPGQ